MRALLLILAVVNLGAAEATLGWDGYYRPGRWTPLYVEAAAPAYEAGQIEVVVPGPDIFGERVTTPAALLPEPTTYALYVRPSAEAGDLTVFVRGGDGRTLDVVPDRTDGEALRARTVVGGRRLLGSAGDRRLGARLDGPGVISGYAVGHVPRRLLPRHEIGYDGLDAMLLGSPAWGRWEAEQVAALARYVETGGVLVLEPGPESVPAGLAGVMDRVTLIDPGADVAAVLGAMDLTAKPPRPDAERAAARRPWVLPLAAALLLVGPGELLLLKLRRRRLWHPVPWLATAGLAALPLLPEPAGPPPAEETWAYGAGVGDDARYTQSPEGNRPTE